MLNLNFITMKTLFASFGLMLGILLISPVQSNAQCSKDKDQAKAKTECAKKDKAKAGSECTKDDKTMASAGDYVKTSFMVEGKCSMCKDRIEKAATSVKGVSKASWNKASHKLALTYDDEKVSKKQVYKTIAKAGHDTEKVKASDKAYAALPNCCKYRSD